LEGKFERSETPEKIGAISIPEKNYMLKKFSVFFCQSNFIRSEKIYFWKYFGLLFPHRILFMGLEFTYNFCKLKHGKKEMSLLGKGKTGNF